MTERRQRLETAAAQARLGLWEYDQRTSRFYWSDVIYEIFGLPAATHIELDAAIELYAAESAEMLGRAIELALRDGKPFSLVSTIEPPGGGRKWIRTQGQVEDQPDSESRRLFGTIQDISELKLLDRVVQESEMTLNQVEQITHIGHWSVSLSDGSFYHSDEIKRIFGYEPSEYALSVDEAINAYHPDDRDEVIRLFNRAVETGQGYEFDLRIIQPSGEVRYVHSKGYTEQDDSGKVTRVYGVFQDVTEQEMTKQALRDSEASMKALVDVVRTAIVVHGKDGEILLTNQMANRLLAPLTTELVGKDVTDPAWRFVDEDGRQIPVEELPASRILRTGEQIENLLIGRAGPDAVAWLLVNGIPVNDDKGELSKVIISFVDITDRKEMEEHLRQSEKMKAVGQLAGGVAHDFNNQLTLIMNYAELLKRSLGSNARQASFVDGIISGVTRSSDLTKQLLAFARKGKYAVTTVDVNQLISEIVSMARHSFDKRITITHTANVAPASIAGDVSQLQNALLNMALNSRDALPSGGEIAFTTDRVTRPGEDGDWLRVTVRDNGAGMDSETKKRIFEPFFTTKGPGKGTGMGMASVYGTVQSHKGAIEVDSEPGEGTTITIQFPMSHATAEKTDAPAFRPAAAGGRILIVDDENGVALSMSMLLEESGYQTTLCSTGREAIEAFRRSWRSTDLVLLDMIMPDMSGVETFRAMKQIDPDVKVVLVSGYSFTDEAKEATQEGAIAFLQKPVDAAALIQTIADALGDPVSG